MACTAGPDRTKRKPPCNFFQPGPIAAVDVFSKFGIKLIIRYKIMLIMLKKAVFFAFLLTLGAVLSAQQPGEIIRGDFVLQGRVLVRYTGKMETLVIPPELGITEIGMGAFIRSGVRRVRVPERVTVIGDDAFALSNVEVVQLPSSLRRIGNRAFYGCKYLASVSLPAAVDYIGNAAFSNTALTSVSLPEGLIYVEENAFYGCVNLTRVTLPAGLTGIGNGAFCNTALTSISLPAWLASIGDGAFYGCRGLTGVVLPPAVVSIGARAFAGCTSLRNIRIPLGTEVGADAFQGAQQPPTYY
jgi:hypothetical protein